MVNLAKLRAEANRGFSESTIINPESVLELIDEVRRLRKLRDDVKGLHASVTRSIELDRLIDEYWFERHLRKILDDNAK